MLAALMATAAIMATPATLQRLVDAARPGALIKLASSRYDRLLIVDKRWNQPITIDATGATLTLNIVQSRGIIIRGGTFADAIGTGSEGYAALIRKSNNIAF